MAACISCSFAVAAGMAALSVAGRGAGPTLALLWVAAQLPLSLVRPSLHPSFNYSSIGVVLGSRPHLAVDDAYMERAWRQGMMAEATEP